jgi:cytochrome c peroxidase
MPWSAQELAVLRALSLSSLPPVPHDTSNAVADDPRAIALGHRLFFDARLSRDGTISCASCHIPELGFQDARAYGRGIAETRRRTRSIVGIGYSGQFFWDGRRDSLWSQALVPLEHPAEQGGDRAMVVRLAAQHYRAEYQELFGALPDMAGVPEHASPIGDASARAAWRALTPARQQDLSHAFANLGKALAAYERRLLPGPSRFDEYVEALVRNDTTRAANTLTKDEVAGLGLFIGKANCVRCHNTPLFSDNGFHNTGVPQHAETERDAGRATGAPESAADEFNCSSRYSDDPENDCPKVDASAGSVIGAFKTPSLRKTRFVAPYMHNAWYTTLPEILDHYNRAPAGSIGETELSPPGLSPVELRQLEAFLLTLPAPLSTPAELQVAP